MIASTRSWIGTYRAGGGGTRGCAVVTVSSPRSFQEWIADPWRSDE